jgi:lysophospholipase L1-like esterase
MIISTSITRDINYEEFNNNYEQGRAHFQRFKGGSAEYIKDYIPVHLKKDKPDSALVQIGGNDLHKAYTNTLLTNLA